MAETLENQTAIELSPEEVFKNTRGDALHSGVKVGLGLLPLAGDLFELLIAAPASKRRDEFLLSVYEGLRALEQKFADFNIEMLVANEVFTSTVIHATQVAIRTRSKKMHHALRNAVLNSALPKSPDEYRQAMFVQLCDELTDIHVDLMSLFQRMEIAYVDVDIVGWGLQQPLNDSIEAVYPTLKGQSPLYLQVINNLYKRGLVQNYHDDEENLTLSRPIPTLFGAEFLAFLESPLDDE